MLILLRKVRDFFKTDLGRYVLIALAVVIALLVLGKCQFDRGVKHEQAAQAERLKKAEKAVAKREVKAEKITSEVKADVTEKQIEYRTVTKTLVKEVPKYVTVQADAKCVVPAGFVSLHDSAASGTPSLPVGAGRSLDAPSGVELSAVAETLVTNYGTAYQWRAEAEGWRRWYAEQKAEWDKR